MSGYIWIIIWSGVIGGLASTGIFDRNEFVNGRFVNRVHPAAAVLAFLPLIIWCGYRGNIGDTGAYISGYASMPDSFSGLPAYYAELTKDKGFYLGSAMIKCVIGNRVDIYFILLAALQSYFLIKVYRKFSFYYFTCFFLFLASTDYISWMFNGIRQFTAVTLTFGCFEWILKKKYIPAVIVILFAAQIHGTALLVLPFVFICQGRAWNKKTLFFLLLVILAVVFVGKFTNILDSILSETQYQNVVSDWQMGEDDGTNFLRVLIYSIPAILAWIGRREIRDADDAVINLCVNMSVVAAGFYIISMFTSGIFIGRIPIYFSLYQYILLPWEIKHIFTVHFSRLVMFMMIIGYLLFYLYSLLHLGIIF